METMCDTTPSSDDVDLARLGDALAELRVCEPAALLAVRRSLEQHGQLAAVTVFATATGLEVLDGFKRVRAARALGWPTLRARVHDVGVVDAKLRLLDLHGGRALTEIEEAWLIRSLYRDHSLSQPEIAQRMRRHKSWVWRRLTLVEALDPVVQLDVRIGLLAPRSATALSRLPRGNQPDARSVVVQRGLTVRQTEHLVDEILACSDDARAALIAQRLHGPLPETPPGPRAKRTNNSAGEMTADILAARSLAARLTARLAAMPLEALAPMAAALLRDALSELSPVLRALDAMIADVTRAEGTA